jgi:hypothetical protein
MRRSLAPAAAFKLCLEVVEVAVPVDIALRLGEPDAIDHTGVVQLVGDDRIFGSQ